MRAFLIFVGVLLFSLVLGAYLLPDTMAQTVRRTIPAPAGDIFPHVAGLRAFNTWSPWVERDPATVYVFTGPERGAGSAMSWLSEQQDVGSGAMEVTATMPDRSVDYRILFETMAAESRLTLEPETDGTTQVTWSFRAPLGMNPIARYMGALYGNQVRRDYELGLERLERTVAAAAQAAPAPPPTQPAPAGLALPGGEGEDGADGDLPLDPALSDPRVVSPLSP